MAKLTLLLKNIDNKGKVTHDTHVVDVEGVHCCHAWEVIGGIWHKGKEPEPAQDKEWEKMRQKRINEAWKHVYEAYDILEDLRMPGGSE